MNFGRKIQTILLDQFSLIEDKNGIFYRTYIGLRGKKNESSKYLQITTRLKKDNIENKFIVNKYSYEILETIDAILKLFKSLN